jgi:hypothetical protein
MAGPTGLEPATSTVTVSRHVALFDNAFASEGWANWATAPSRENNDGGTDGT